MTASQPRPGTTVLVVDDEESVRRALVRCLGRAGFDCAAVEGLESALEAYARRGADVVLCDIQLHNESGLDLLPRLRAIDPDVAIVMVTGAGDARSATRALTTGAADYVTKPFANDEIIGAVRRACVRRETALEEARVRQVIDQKVAERTVDLERQQRRLEVLSTGIAETLINAMEAKNAYLRGHSQRVAELAASIAHEMRLGPTIVERVRLAGRLHDVGKIGIRESVLDKPTSLSEEEYEHVKEHVRVGLNILAPLAHLGDVLDFIRDHHERANGSGYPHGISGDAISIGGRILAAADAFDALTSRRAYRESISDEQALDYMAGLVPDALFPEVFEALASIVRRRQTLVYLFEHAQPPATDPLLRTRRGSASDQSV